jgi:hypothetical protein
VRNTLVYTTRTGNPNHARMVAIIAAAAWNAPNHRFACPSDTPEPHEAGEFPMSCGACHRHENY